jgi:drug/metabolite transporter (DMT)-like permease
VSANHALTRPPGSAASRAGVLALLAGALMMSFAPIFIRWSEVGPVATAFWRLTLALPFLWTWLLLRRPASTGPQTPLTGREALLLIVPGLFFAGDQALWYWSVKLTTAANATLLVNFAPLFVTPVAWVWLRERFTLSFPLGAALALGGIWFLMGASRVLGGQHPEGDALALGAAVFYSGYLLTVKRLRGRHSAVTVMAWSSLACAPLLLLIALASGEGLFAMTARGWLTVLGLAVVCHISGQGLIAYALAHLPAGFSSVSLLAQPVVVAALAWAILGEPLSGGQVVGGLLVLAGICLARRGSEGRAQQA